ncbi:type IV pilus secretin PilQ [Sulfuricella denitrificans skB26]|uniref:Type IV pilus secretin PilQ n=1 Tax=Sulfuricella denitrificans (strain DSM 22764 / NBRC 105220 / skB26) TaxID=1163617 RepID=S6APC6_SULDS|nr:type IV pilus secretin PilQ [Sulfuricella denitrificans]BAN36744.1 type IV pilus secretin PilQ [Sulfuricella denitrificans skB26]
MNIIKSTIRCFIQVVCLTTLFIANSHAAVEPGSTSPEAAQMPQNSIESVDYAALQNGKFLITLKLKHALKNPPAGFAVNNPPRIALDLPDTANTLGKNTINIGEGVLRNLNIVQAGSRTRLVINLTKPAGYETKIAGDTLLITLQGTESTGVTSNVSAKFAEAPPGSQKHALRDVDFRRGKGGEGRVVVDLSDANTGIDIRTEGKSIVVEFINTTLPRNLERKLDVVDFGTPVQTVSTFGHGNNARLVIEPKGLWEHSAYQTDHQFILDVKPIVEDSSKLVQGTKAGYSGEKLSLDFQNIETRTLLAVLADFAEMNVVISDSVRSSTTLRLKDVPWDQALDITLKQSGLSMRKSGNVIMIAPSEELATKEKLELEAKQQISELEQLRTETFQLKYTKAESFQKILADDKQKILSKRGSAVWDPRTNMLFIQDTPAKLEDVRKLINQIDIPVRQVMIEARIVEASDTFSRALGARLGFQDHGSITGTNQRAMVGGQLEAPGYGTGQAATIPTYSPQGMNVNLPAKSSSGTAGVLSMILFQSNATRFLNLELSALQADGKGKIISNPRVLTSDQSEAVIEDGTEIPYLQASSSGSTSVSFKKAVLSLKVKPQITPDDNIIMDLKVNKDSRGVDTVAGPAINTKQITTQVLVENGGTVVIGGIFNQEESTTVTKVPLLGDIPVLGFMFRNTDKRDDKRELLVFVTPKILKESLNLR